MPIPGFGFVSGFGIKNMLQNLRLHPFTVIIYGEVNAAAAVHTGDLDEPLSVLIFDSMVYGIFHHRAEAPA